MDKSEFIYKSLKEGKTLNQIAEQLNLDRRCSYYLMDNIFNCITDDCWLIRNQIQFLEFFTMLPYINNYIIVCLRHYIFDNRRMVIEYNEKYCSIIRTFIDKFIASFREWQLKHFICIFQNYIEVEVILDAYLKGDLNNQQLKVLLKAINKRELFDKFVFTRGITNG